MNTNRIGDIRETVRLMLVGTGMAVAISCNTVLGSMFHFASAGQIAAAIAVAGALMLVIGWCYVDLFALYPSNLAIRAFSRVVLGERWSLAFSMLYVALVIGLGAFEARLCFEVLQAWLSPSMAGAVVFLVTAGILAINLRGAELGASVQIATTLSMVFLIWALCFAFGTGANEPVLLPLELHTLAAIPTALFLFVGIEWACLHAKGRHSFQRHLVPAVAGSVLLLVSLYAPFALVLGGALDAPVLANTELPHLALSAGHSIAWHTAVAISLLAFTTSFNVGLSGAAKVLYALAREGSLDSRLASLSVPHCVPARAMWWIAGAVALISPCLFVETIFRAIPRVMALNLCAAYLATLWCWLRLAARHPRNTMNRTAPRWAVAATSVFLMAILVDTLVTQTSTAAWLVMLIEAAVIAGFVLHAERGRACAGSGRRALALNACHPVSIQQQTDLEQKP